MAIKNIIEGGTRTPINDSRISDADMTSWNGKYTKPSSGIPSTDLSESVNTALTNGNAARPILGSITTSTTWTDMQDGTYVQTISSITGVTNNTKIDLQPNATVLDQMITDICKALYVTNNNSVLTLVAVGASISTSVTIQYTRVEVSQ